MLRSNSVIGVLVLLALCQFGLTTDFRKEFGGCPVHLQLTADVQKVLVIIKPDAVRRGFSQKIVDRFIDAHLTLLKSRTNFLTTEAELAIHYVDHVGKPYYPKILSSMTASPISVYLFEGINAVWVASQIVGATDPKAAAPGTIRYDFGIDIDLNSVYSSYSPDVVAREIALGVPEPVATRLALKAAPATKKSP